MGLLIIRQCSFRLSAWIVLRKEFRIGLVLFTITFLIKKTEIAGHFGNQDFFATHLVAAYLLTLKCSPPKATVYKVIYLLTILTTKSSAGYCLMILCLILEMTLRLCSGISKKQTIISFILILVILFAALFVSSNEEIMSTILLGKRFRRWNSSNIFKVEARKCV